MTKKRNPIAHSMMKSGLFRPKVAKSAKERERHRDPWERSTKHKNGQLDSIEDE